MSEKKLQNSHVPVHLIEKTLANQAKELEIRNNELEFRKQNDQNQLEFAKSALISKENIHKEHNKNTFNLTIAKYIFSGIIAIILALFLGGALYLNKTELALKIINAILYIGAGAIGGYSYGYSYTKDKKSE